MVKILTRKEYLDYRADQAISELRSMINRCEIAVDNMIGASLAAEVDLIKLEEYICDAENLLVSIRQGD